MTVEAIVRRTKRADEKRPQNSATMNTYVWRERKQEGRREEGNRKGDGGDGERGGGGGQLF